MRYPVRVVQIPSDGLAQSGIEALGGHPPDLNGDLRRVHRVTAIVSRAVLRSEEHTSELQSQSNLVCRLLLEKKKKTNEQRRVRYVYSVRTSCAARRVGEDAYGH